MERIVILGSEIEGLLAALAAERMGFKVEIHDSLIPKESCVSYQPFLFMLDSCEIPNLDSFLIKDIEKGITHKVFDTRIIHKFLLNRFKNRIKISFIDCVKDVLEIAGNDFVISTIEHYRLNPIKCDSTKIFGKVTKNEQNQFYFLNKKEIVFLDRNIVFSEKIVPNPIIFEEIKDINEKHNVILFENLGIYNIGRKAEWKNLRELHEVYYEVKELCKWI